ncbi:MAG: glycosyltransferase family 2 protein [Roseivirga sp.]
MKISIITVVYNSEKTISDAIDSVLGQKGIDLEYIVIDGKSQDDTMRIVESYGSQIHKVISEPDGGIYDAMNKGVSLATGDIIGILNSDDVYASDNILSQVSGLFDRNDIDCIYGDLMYVRQDDLSKMVRYWKAGKYISFKRGWHPPHPTFFVKKEIYDKHGLYNTDLRVSADFDMMLRLLEKHKCSVEYFPELVVKMRTGGESNKSLKNIVQGYHDMKKAFKINGISRPFYYPFLRYLPKLREFIR